MSKSDDTGLATGGHKWRTQKEALDEGVDLVVATPARLGQHIEAATLRLTQCQAVVLDEADVLLGDAYAFSQQVTQGSPKLVACCYCQQSMRKARLFRLFRWCLEH